MIQKFVKLRVNLIIIIMTNILILQNLMLYLVAGVFHARLKLTKLVTKTDFDTKLKKISDRATSTKSKHLLVEAVLKKIKKIDTSYFKGKEYFGTDGLQNYLVLQLISKYLKTINGNIAVSEWISKGISNGVLKAHNTPSPQASARKRNMYLEFNGSCLKTTEKYYFYPGMISSNLNNFDPTLQNCLFGAVILTKNADIDKYKYMGYGIGFDSKGTFLFPDDSFGLNVIIFEADISRSAHANNKTRNILVLGKELIEGTDGRKIYAEKMYSINFTKGKTRFCLSLHYNKENSNLFVNGTEIYKFKAKEYEIKDGEIEMCLGNISTGFSAANMKKTGLYGNVYDFSIDLTPIAVNYMLDIHNYLMKKTV